MTLKLDVDTYYTFGEIGVIPDEIPEEFDDPDNPHIRFIHGWIENGISFWQPKPRKGVMHNKALTALRNILLCPSHYLHIRVKAAAYLLSLWYEL